MNRHDIQLLQRFRGYPALTITLPTHRTAPDNRQDPIRLRNLVTQAVERLSQEFSRRELEPLLTRLEKLVQDIDYRHALDGLAVFANRDFGRAFALPFELKERVMIDEGFAVRDLIYALNRTPRYWVLVLGEKPTRLFEGARDSLVEVTEEGFPLIHTGPGGEAALPGGFGIRKSAYRDERHRQFFRQVDSALRPFLLDDPLPLAVVGVDRFLAFFKEVSAHNAHVITTLTGSHSKTSLPKLSALVWPLVKANLAEARRQVMGELEQAIGARKFASTIGETWRLAQEGRGQLLIVEENFHFPARLDASGFHLEPAEVEAGPDVLDDAVDELIKVVLDKEGRVVFVEDGLLAEHQRIALILRY